MFSLRGRSQLTERPTDFSTEGGPYLPRESEIKQVQGSGVTTLGTRKSERMAGTTRLELATSAVTGQRSNQLNYVPAEGWNFVTWWALKDLNLRPFGCKPNALTAELSARTVLQPNFSIVREDAKRVNALKNASQISRRVFYSLRTNTPTPDSASFW